MSKPIRLVPQTAQPIEFTCPLCSNHHAAYVFGTDRFRIYRCAGCSLTFGSDRREVGAPPSDRMPFAAKVVRGDQQHAALIAALEAAAIRGPALVVADRQDSVVRLLESRNIAIGRVVDEKGFAPASWGQSFESAVVSDALMRAPDPRAALLKIHQHLPEGAPLIISMPLLDGRQARLMGLNWHEWQPANRWYFTRETLTLLLLSAGFEHVWFEPERRRYSLDDLIERMSRREERTIGQRGLEMVRRVSPGVVRRATFRLPTGTSVVTATRRERRPECVVSIVVPVFNERRTFPVMMDALLGKSLPGMRKEIIIVESGSTDGTRELVETYQQRPGVKVIFQQSPRGKGNAVREGFRAATGDILMIQDADLEYDLDDYDGLLAPLASWQAMFVLGSRHQGGWKMRKFTDAALTAAAFNLAHGCFRGLVNLALGSKMSDPFTMFKIFRRDALHGLGFVCNRFDFDIELVIKLVRKGYVPLELPVNYVSRSFSEGKKVRVVRDGLTWVWTILRARFCALGTAA
jgi:hypothetical protein